jgi:hypothetical protein
LSSYTLVDYENVGPALRGCLIKDDEQVLVFLGQTNAKVHPHISRWLGRRAEYITINGRGPNALDFQIAYYVGTLVQSSRDCTIQIVSGDKGFDPLIGHLRDSGINIKRSTVPAKIQYQQSQSKLAQPVSARDGVEFA